MAFRRLGAAGPAWAEDEKCGDKKYSKIGGQLVPVDEPSKYEFAHNNWNSSFGPIGSMYGKFSVAVSYAMCNVMADAGAFPAGHLRVGKSF
ncbi:MAG: hypothetical protein VYA34_06490 [Myxococcota bacterium]|nr:hypothetical protein [Myxococcota bacterium]